MEYNELYHHGVEGQKWGVRRYQNYDGTRIGSNRDSSRTIGRNSALGEKYFIEKSGLANREVGDLATEAAIELGVCAAVFAAFAVYAKIRQNKLTKEYNEELDYMQSKRDINSLKEAPRLSKPMKAEDSMKVVNPGYPNPGSTSNCMLCTTAMVLREKGYDVKANTIDHGLYEKNIDRMWGAGGEFKEIKARKSEDIIKQLNSEGDGAYGNLTVTWNLGGGHSIFWKNENGKTRIYDGQSGEEYDVSNPEFSKLLKSINPGGSQYSRLDNVEPNELVLAAVKRR